MTISLAGPLSSGVAAGVDASATNNATSTAVLSGVVRGVYIDYKDSPPAGTTDVTIATAGVNAPAETIYYKESSATDGSFYPETLFNLNTTGAAIASLYDFMAIHDKVTVTIAGANAADYINVYIYLEN